ncbi:acyltransferase ChoActase/COT/CPT [Ascobolus immersus RN42]|uniref:Carnitine O-acetyltransferase, mitochondrial n=1 Tax=Ascobolus immersus RN42 TaxID=1160509 RepID=A0A3N4HKU2_ASCIM|nr:acyltransferase ChoActase/COT/CPT [Ascobolus immersus RN42]
MWNTLSRGRPTVQSLKQLTSVSRNNQVFRNNTVGIMAAARKQSTLPAGYKEDHSKGAMLRFEESLPKLPVPTLEESTSRYLKSVKPLLTPEEFQKTASLTKDFVKPGGIAEKLQERLVAKANDPQVKNWMLDWWNDQAYLAYRDPVVPYVSYFYSYKDDKARRDPAKRAAAITTGALKFKKMVDEGSLEPEYMRKAPISMDSYKYMFNCSRIPAKPADFPKIYDWKTNKHIVVARKGQFFKVPQEHNGQQLSAAEFEAIFNRIYETADSSAPAIGALTSENRDVWTEARETLISADPSNLASLEVIESSSFVICLDDARPVTLEERAHQYWHGDGTNRFYDKPLQFIICDNGAAGFMGEHSMMDGTPTHRINDYINDQIFNAKLDLGAPTPRSELPIPTAIPFRSSDALTKAISQAKTDFADVIGKHELAVLQYPGYGKGLIKKFRSSPDAYVQMLIQLAYYKMYGVSRPTYESAATRKFAQGRTETCRTVSEESVAWVKAMQDPTVSADEAIKLFRAAINGHVEYISAASDGKGVDRHFFGLKNSLKEGEEVPEFFKDPAFSYSCKWYLSTSQLSSEYFNGYGWSQVQDEGYGIAYMINENSLQFNIVSKRLGVERMRFYLTEAAADMRELLERELEGPKAKL